MIAKLHEGSAELCGVRVMMLFLAPSVMAGLSLGAGGGCGESEDGEAGTEGVLNSKHGFEVGAVTWHAQASVRATSVE